jgi:hypothetical protein
MLVLCSLLLTGCADGESMGTVVPTAVLSSEAKKRTLDENQRAALALELKDSIRCDDSDELYDDLEFWDSMRGWDCYDAEPVFIRVYEHESAVPYALTEFDETFSPKRTVVRGKHWFVVGPPDVVDAVRIPGGEPTIPYTRNEVGDGITKEDFVTTCMLHGLDEAMRTVEKEPTPPPDEQQYERVFPGIAKVAAKAMDKVDAAKIRTIPDRDRWLAALTPIGPTVKSACWKVKANLG